MEIRGSDTCLTNEPLLRTNTIEISVKPPLPKPCKRKPNKTTSSVWDHFTKMESSDSNGPRCKCNYCDKDYACDTTSCGTSTLWKHLKKQCKKYPYREDKGQKNLAFQPISDGKGGSNLVATSFSQQACRAALIRMIIIDELSFKFVEAEGFLYFCSIACPKFDPPSRITVSRDVWQLYLDEKKKLKSILAKDSQRVSLTTDTWTSLQNINYMVLTAHYIDSEWTLQKRILNFCQVANHKGETIGKVVESCLLEWGIDKIFSITVDNASSNDVAISYLKRRLKSWKTLIMDGELLQMRCCAHIINLIVTDGLKDLHVSIASVRNAVRYVRSSPKRLKKFKDCVEKEKIDCKALVCLDVATRWNSTYLMLDHALKFEKAFQILEEDDIEFLDFFMENDHGNKRVGPPSSDDWKSVRVFVKFLKTFYDVTLKISGSLYVTSNLYFQELYEIQERLIKWSRYPNSVLCSMASKMKIKFDKYWGSVDKINKVLFLAVVLDPRYKLDYVTFCFANVYDDDTLKEMSEMVKSSLFHLYEFYKLCDKAPSVQEHSESQPLSCTTSLDSSDDDEMDISLQSRYKKRREEKNSVEVKNDVDRYLSEPTEDLNDNFDVLNWWKLNASKYRILSQVARDVLAVPVSTVASESAFSTGGRILDSFRSSLQPEMVQALICAQNWIRSKSVLLDLPPQVDDLEFGSIESGESSTNKDHMSFK